MKAKHSPSAKGQERILSTVKTVKAQQQLILFIHYQVMAGNNNCTETSDHTMNGKGSTSNDGWSLFLIAFGLQRIELNLVISTPLSQYPGREICIKYHQRFTSHITVVQTQATADTQLIEFTHHLPRKRDIRDPWLEGTFVLHEDQKNAGGKNHLTLYRAHNVTWLIILSQSPGYVSWHLLRLYQNRDSDSVHFHCSPDFFLSPHVPLLSCFTPSLLWKLLISI